MKALPSLDLCDYALPYAPALPPPSNRTAACGSADALLDGGDNGEAVTLPDAAGQIKGRRGRRVLRYLTLFASRSAGLCLAFKAPDLTRPNALARFFSLGIGAVMATCNQEGLNFSGSELVQVLPSAGVGPPSMTHNAALLRLPGEQERERFLVVGGEGSFWSAAGSGEAGEGFAEVELQGGRSVSPAVTADPASGIWATRGPGWSHDATTWERPRLAVGATHAGCVDVRLKTGYGGAGCEYDGRLSLVRHRGAFLLYARANLRECAPRGGRFVQVAVSADGRSWGPMRPIALREYDPDSGDIYFFAAQENPVDIVDASGGGGGSRSLLALFPLSQPPRACLGLAFSIDGVKWSQVVNLRSCKAAPGGRTVDHPVAGGMVVRGETAYVYVQHAVPGIAPLRARTHVRRYSLRAATLRRLTSEAREALLGR